MSGNLGDCLSPAAPDAKMAFTIIGGDGADVVQSYGVLRRRIDSVAAAARASGLPPRAAVAILSANDEHYFPAFLGLMQAGFIACPVNWRLGRAQIEATLRDAGASLVLCDAERIGAVSAWPRSETAAFAAEPDGVPPYAPSSDDVACLMYTSGSTGEPKGVPVTHAGYLWGLDATTGEVGDHAYPSVIAAPLYHMNGQFHALAGVFSAGARVLMRRFDADLYLDAVVRHGVRTLSGVPTMAAMCCDLIDGGTHAEAGRLVTTVAIGSAPLSEKLYDRLRRCFPNASVFNGYGTTESGVVSFGAHPDGRPTPPLSLGAPEAGVEVRLVGAEAPDRGVLHIRSPMTARGYHRRPDLSAAKFHEGWYDTGDIMRRDADGFYFFEGRVDDMFVCGGENVHPLAVARLLESHPDVLAAGVAPVPDERKGALPAAFVVLRPGASLDPLALKQFAIANGPAFAHPRFVAFLDALPLNAVGKPDQLALKQMALARFGSA